MVSTTTMSKAKGKEKIQLSVVEDDEDGDSDSSVGQGDEEEEDDDSEGEEEESDCEDEEYDGESDSDQSESLESDESYDEDEDYGSIIKDQSKRDDKNNVCSRNEDQPTENVLSYKVVNLLRQGNKKLDMLKLEECKAYLRKHELMISGTKAVCIQRILEHWRLKDGNGERLYPKSSFTINCTGDVCKGDIVMFKQKVYNKFDKVSRSGEVIGKRTVAGRIVKESYGVAKQQHTFTIEVLWSKGVKPLSPLYALLVKGRNLYRYKTFRQSWRNEAERKKVLEEKHGRGAKARHVRASNQIRKYAGSKHQSKPSNSRNLPNKRLKKDSKAPPTKQLKEILNSRTRGNDSSRQKHASNTSTTMHAKMHGTKVSSSRTMAPSYTDLRQVNHHGTAVNRHEIGINPLHNFARRPTLCNNYDDSHIHLHQRINIAADPQIGRERFHFPSYNNYDYNLSHSVPLMHDPRRHHHHHHHQMINERTNYTVRPYSVHASQLDPRDNLGHPYSTHVSQHASRSSSHFFTPAIHDYDFHRR